MFFCLICRWKGQDDKFKDEIFQPDNIEKICDGRLLRLLGLPKTENKLIKAKVWCAVQMKYFKIRLLGLPKTENKLIKDKVCFS